MRLVRREYREGMCLCMVEPVNGSSNEIEEYTKSARVRNIRASTQWCSHWPAVNCAINCNYSNSVNNKGGGGGERGNGKSNSRLVAYLVLRQ